MRIVSFMPIVAGLLICSSACQREEAPVGPQQADLLDLFELKEEFVLHGQEQASLFSPIRPILVGDRIYVADWQGHQVFTYNRAGELLHVFGQMGEGPGDFQRPSSIAFDDVGNLYVSDAGNMRVQVFDSAYNHLRTIAAPGQNEQLFLINEDASLNLLLQGVGRCQGGEGSCLFQQYDLEGGQVRTFGKFTWADISMFTWQAARDEEGRFYLVNVFGSEVQVFGPGGTYQNSFELGSPAIRQMPELASVDETEQRRRVREEPHTSIRAIFVSEGHILVQFTRRNWATDEATYFLDIYDTAGQLKYYGIDVPGVLQGQDEGILIYSDIDAEFGGVKVGLYQMNL